MKRLCPGHEHASRRALLQGSLVTAGGLAVPNWGGLINSQTIAAQAKKRSKHCILLWMNGGASQIDTFDMKPGRPTGGLFRPIASNVTGLQVCEYLPQLAKVADRQAVLRGMQSHTPGHPPGMHLEHICNNMPERPPHAARRAL